MKKISIANGETRIGYSFDDLDSSTQEKVLDSFSNTSLEYEWWENVYEDAKTVGIKINEFDTDRGSMIKGEFYDGAHETIDLIKEHHGEECETYKTAMQYEQEWAELRKQSDIKYKEEYGDELGLDENEDLEWNMKQYFEDNNKEDWEDDFRKAILEDYLVMLRHEAEHLSSHEAAKENIEANDYLFDEEGEILPITYHMEGNVCVKHTWKRKHECTLTDIEN